MEVSFYTGRHSQISPQYICEFGTGPSLCCGVRLRRRIGTNAFFGFGGNKGGVILEDTEAFRILAGISPEISHIDFFKFMQDLEMLGDEIADMEKILIG